MGGCGRDVGAVAAADFMATDADVWTGCPLLAAAAEA
jgi:hypothetical protein